MFSRTNILVQADSHPETPSDPSNSPERGVPSGTLSVFSSAAYRYYFFGQLVSLSGTWMQAAAQQVVVFNLTQQEIALGLTACAQGLPALILTPLVGVLVENVPRRRILFVTQAFMMVLALMLAALNFSGTLQLWHIIALSVGLGIANAIDAPTRQAMVVELVGKNLLASGIAMNAIMFNTARVIGPFFGGFALAFLGTSWCFLLNGLSFLAVLVSIVRMRLHPVDKPPPQGRLLHNIAEGLRFGTSHPVIMPLLLIAICVSAFGTTFATLYAPFAQDVFGNVEVGTSALLGFQGVGTLIGSVWVARISSRGHRGMVLVAASILAPVSVIMVALARPVWLVLGLIMLAGALTIMQFILINTLIQTVVPEAFRGRVLSMYTMTVFGLNPFGSLLISALAQATTVQTAMLIFAVFTLICGIILAVRTPQVRGLR